MAEDTTSEAKKKIDSWAKEAEALVEHLELDLTEVKKHLKSIEEYSHGGGGTGASKGELSHGGGGNP
jgi:hypothetical protein